MPPGLKVMRSYKPETHVTKRSSDAVNENQARIKQEVVISLHEALNQPEEDVEGVPFTLSVLFGQKGAQNKELILCIWELHDGSNQFDLHPRLPFNAQEACMAFQQQHQLIYACF